MYMFTRSDRMIIIKLISSVGRSRYFTVNIRRFALGISDICITKTMIKSNRQMYLAILGFSKYYISQLNYRAKLIS